MVLADEEYMSEDEDDAPKAKRPRLTSGNPQSGIFRTPAGHDKSSDGFRSRSSTPLPKKGPGAAKGKAKEGRSEAQQSEKPSGGLARLAAASSGHGARSAGGGGHGAKTGEDVAEGSSRATDYAGKYHGYT